MALNYKPPIEKITDACDEGKPLPEDEQAIFNAIKEHVREDGCNVLNDEGIIRLVRGYKYEVENGGMDKWREVAFGEADKIVKWRTEIDAPTLLGRKFEKGDIFDDSWHSKLCGIDHQGHPVVVERLADFNVEKLIANFTPEEVTIYQAQRQERAQAACSTVSKTHGKLVYKHVYVLDLSGLSKAHFDQREYLKAIFHVGQYYFPETLHKMFLLNTPWLFRALWKIITPWIHPITRAKINLLGKDYLETMKKAGIDKDMLPPAIGGEYESPQATWTEDAESSSDSVGTAEL